mmetsp:Transcript_12592/g.30484  ORF Transcript_12592/g.30484 Transcript_12592/m.30484 type:complete len:266 (+) Transcript_12592:243-1040(+)
MHGFDVYSKRDLLTSSGLEELDLFLLIEKNRFPKPTNVPFLTHPPTYVFTVSMLLLNPGIFEGRTGSLLHPVMMFGMLALSLSTALLGFDWRRQRTIGDDISALKKTLPDLGGASTVADAIAAAKAAETPDNALISKLQAATSIEKEIQELQAERKQLADKGPRDKHYGQGAWLALLGTWFAIEGPLNTYARAGKLFPGPHLYAGAGLVCLWALAVSAIPQMQKGNDTARYVHIGANIGGIALFAWQVKSGIPILLKVIEFTKWP